MAKAKHKRGRPKGSIGNGQPSGNRTASGRLRNREMKRVEPCMGVQRRHDLYRVRLDIADATERHQRKGRMEDSTCDALGRAFTAGLLGRDEQRARQLLDAGRKIAAQYWRIYGFGSPDSLARFQPQKPTHRPDPDRERIIEDALNDALGMVRARGHDVRRAFEQLVIDLNPDFGPGWLDQIVFAHRSKRTADERDMAMLRLAVEGLEAIA